MRITFTAVKSIKETNKNITITIKIFYFRRGVAVFRRPGCPASPGDHRREGEAEFRRKFSGASKCSLRSGGKFIPNSSIFCRILPNFPVDHLPVMCIIGCFQGKVIVVLLWSHCVRPFLIVGTSWQRLMAVSGGVKKWQLLGWRAMTASGDCGLW